MAVSDRAASSAVVPAVQEQTKTEVGWKENVRAASAAFAGSSGSWSASSSGWTLSAVTPVAVPSSLV